MAGLDQIVGALRSYQDTSNSDTANVMVQARYNKYVQTVKSMGGQPLSREDWIAAGMPDGT